MPRKGKDEPLMDLDTQEQEELDFLTFIQDVGPTIASVDVFRVNRDGSRPHIERVTMEAIQEDVYSYLRTLGPGKYLLKFRGSDGMYKKGKVLEVADKNAAPPGAITPSSGESEHVKFMREQLAQQQNLVLALIAAMGSNKPTMPDLSFLAGVLRPPDMTPVTTLMAAMLNRKTEALDGVGLAKTIVELGRDIAGDGAGKEENFWSVAKDVGRGVVEKLALPPGPPPPGMTYASPGQVIVRPMQQQPPGPVNNLPGPQVVHTPQEEAPLTKENFPHYLRLGITELKKMAARNRDVELTVDSVLEDAETVGMWAAVAGAVQQGATFDNLLQFDPEIAQTPMLKDWFGRFYNGLYAEIFNNVDTAGAGGDAPNPGGNAGAGPTGPVATPDTKPGG